MKKLWVEIQHRSSSGCLIKTTLREATSEDIEYANYEHSRGKCSHSVCYDESGWLYDTRICATCGRGLGLV